MGAAGLIALAWSALVVLFVAAAALFEPAIRRLANRTRTSMLLLGLLPIFLRLAMLPQAPVPTPRTPDDFGFVLLGDTFAHFRLANPPHPMHRFFETNFVLQEPTYSSIYPAGQGLLLALGQLLFRSQWAGILIAAGVFCALCYWMLRAWTTPSAAFAGGLLTVFTFGPLQYWMNTYWGGSLAAAGGCLVFGSLPRLRAHSGVRYALLLGTGLAIDWLTRPFETLLIVLAAALYLRRARLAAFAAIAVLPALALTLCQDRAVTGHWTTLPYMLSQYQYGIPTSFTFQPVPQPYRPLTQEQQTDYEMQVAVHGNAPDSPAQFARRLVMRVRFLRYFFPVPILLILPAFLLSLRERRFRWLLAALAIMALGTNFYPYFYPHYVAGAACLFVLAGITGLQKVACWNPRVAQLVFLLVAAQFLFWYGAHLLGATNFADQYESWDFVNQSDPEGRRNMDRQLAQAPGRQLVFVRYSPRHPLNQWVYNAADIDSSRVVRALDLGPAEDARLRAYYPNRTAWLLEPDVQPPRLTRYDDASAPGSAAH